MLKKGSLKGQQVIRTDMCLFHNLLLYSLQPLVSRCTRCAEFTARCRKATEMNLRSQLERAQQQHLKDVLQYRAIQTRLCALSEAATSGDGVEVAASVLKIDVDGLDQAKTRWPRMVENAKRFLHAGDHRLTW